MTETTNPYDFIEGRKVVVSEDAYYIENRLVKSSKDTVRGTECYLTQFPYSSTSYGRHTALVSTGEDGTWSFVDAACLSHPLPPAWGTLDRDVQDEPVTTDITEPSGGRVTYYDTVLKRWITIHKTSKGWMDISTEDQETDDWKYWIDDAAPGSVRVVN